MGVCLLIGGCAPRNDAPSWRADCPPLVRPAPLSLEAAREAERLAGRRSFAQTQLVSARGQAKRLARPLQAEGRGPGERGAVCSPARPVVARRAPADQQADAQQPRRPERRHGTKSFGSRESDARKTRTLARAGSSSAR